MMKRILRFITVFLITILGVCLVLGVYGFRVNLSESMPLGIYRKVSADAERGMLAATCLTPELAELGLERGYLQTGWCSTGINPVFKKIVAVPGDMVDVSQDSIRINSKVYNGYPLLDTDSHGRRVLRDYDVPIRLKEKQYWLMSDYKPNSWDSRYWGPVQVKYVLQPVFLFKQTDCERRL